MSPDLIRDLLLGVVGVVLVVLWLVSVRTLLATRRVRLREAYNQGYNDGRFARRMAAMVPSYGDDSFANMPIALGEHFDDGAGYRP